MAYRRKGGPRGRRCIRRKRVRVRGQGMALRCVKYGAKSAGRSTKRRSKKRRSSKRRYGRKPVGMAKRGSRCTRYKRVRVRGHGYARRCAHYSRR